MRASIPKVGVIGAGQWGKNLIRNFSQLGVLRTICDRNPATLKRFAGQYPDLFQCLDYTDILRDPDIQAVVIATPSETHHALAKEALMAGKDVFVEKPLCLRGERAMELIALAKERQKILMVGHLLRYHPAFVKLRELVEEGVLGRVYYIYSNRLNLGKIRREENILWSFAPHDISAILALVDEMPETIVSRGGNYLHNQIADVTMSVLEFASGLRSHIFVSWLHPYKEQRLVVVGDEKMAVFDDMAPAGQKLLLYPYQIEWGNQIPTTHRAETISIVVSDVEPLRLECQHFLECVRTRSRPLTDGAEGFRVLEVLDACQRSLDQGKTISLKDERDAGYFAHPTAIIDQPCEIGRGTRIWHFAHVMAGARIGRNCTLGQNVMVAPNAVIGDNIKIQNNVSVYAGVKLEDDVFCGPSMVFTNVINPRSHISRRHEFQPTIIRKGATIGANATIVCGHEIGSYAFIGAGAVVTCDVPAFALALGVPARLAGWICRCGERLTVRGGRAVCRKCGEGYLQIGTEELVGD